jgi:hypothetical protein
MDYKKAINFSYRRIFLDGFMNRTDAITIYKKIMHFSEDLTLTCIDVSAIKKSYVNSPIYELRVTGQGVNQKLKGIVETIPQQNLTITQTDESLVII